MFDEIFKALDYFKINRFDLLLRIKKSEKLYSASIKSLFESFIDDTKKDLFDLLFLLYQLLAFFHERLEFPSACQCHQH